MPVTSREWYDYYQREAATKRFHPASDPAEEHRCRFALQLRLGMARGSVTMPLADLARRAAQICPAALDAGCGDAYLLSLMRDAGIRTLAGADISLPRLVRTGNIQSHIALQQADVYHLPFRDSSFDTVFCVEVLEHTEWPVEALRELHRVAARFVVISVPYDRPPRMVVCPRCGAVSYLDGHVQRFTQHSLSRACEAAGLGVRLMRGYATGINAQDSPVAGRLKRVARQLLAPCGLVAPPRPRYLGALCEART